MREIFIAYGDMQLREHFMSIIIVGKIILVYWYTNANAEMLKFDWLSYSLFIPR